MTPTIIERQHQPLGAPHVTELGMTKHRSTQRILLCVL